MKNEQSVQPYGEGNGIRVMDLRGTYKGGGGPDKTVLNSAARHDPDKVQVLVVYLRQPKDDQFSIPSQARRLGIRYLDLEDGGLLDPDCLRRLAGLLDAHQISVLHAHDDKTLLYGWLLSLVRPGLRILFTCHSHAVASRPDFRSLADFLAFKARQRVLIFLMQRFLKPVLTVSNDTKRRLVASGLAEGEIAVLPNGIDTTVWSRRHATPVLRRELGVGPEGLLVGTVARITPEKDLATFYRTASAVVSQLPGTLFAVVGDGYGNELELARREVAALGLAKVIRFTGHREDLADVYASFDVFLMSSLSEGMPNTLLEAMAMGLPTVATSVGGIPELLEHGTQGYLAPAGAAEELAGHVLSLLRSPALRERFGASSRLRVERHFDFDGRVRWLERYYAWFAGAGPLPEPAGGGVER
ncbi:glycosyltransferase family 4 protein [Geomonas sp.]|uniref:glycosyltransferase family 4 protein n=1 Tax=Geomonas sp. TaxID=2651584 RepID=UPI002B45DFBB|nr:glycosyltransferase family 4 protein [Geomonas sp.]HJV33619.1 glycosyltransferase family 4 protein [Geomonas sp.]